MCAHDCKISVNSGRKVAPLPGHDRPTPAVKTSGYIIMFIKLFYLMYYADKSIKCFICKTNSIVKFGKRQCILPIY